MKKVPNLSQKVTRKDLANILGVCYNTARKDYNIIKDSLELKRTYLTIADLQTYGIVS